MPAGKRHKSPSKNKSAVARPDSGEANTADEAQGEGAGAPLRYGKHYTGTLIAGDNKSLVYTVKVGEQEIPGCHWAAGISAGLLGIKTHMLPPRGTEVELLYNNPPVITRALGGDRFDPLGGQSSDATGMLKGGRGELDTPEHEDWAFAAAAHTVPRDMLEGELDLSNHLGVGLRLMTLFAGLSGSERAKIEAFVLDDMVRIVSDCFKHYSAFGDMQIYNDGRLNVRFDGTSYPHESWGLLSPKDEKAKVQGATVETEEDLMRTGRNRFSQFIGFLGDFVHQFVTEPSAAITGIAEDAIRPGKSRFAQLSDGTILMQSVTEIALERVCRTQVPVEKKRQDDPEGNTAEGFKSLDARFLKIWDFGGAEARTIHHTAYQLREYARWLSCFHSYARFHQLSDDWTIPNEDAEGVAPSWGNQEEDVESQIGDGLDHYDTYSTIRLMRDGSVVIWDGYGNGFVSGKSGVEVSSVGNLTHSAAGDIINECGGDFIVRARRNVEISAVMGGLILKSRTWWKALCEMGRLWLKSDAQDPEAAGFDEGAAVNPGGDPPDYPEPELGPYAIMLEATKGGVALSAPRNIVIDCHGEPDDPAGLEDTTASVLISSRFQDVRLFGGRGVNIKSVGDNEGMLTLDAGGGGTIMAQSLNFFSSANLFDVRPYAEAGMEDPVRGGAVTIESGKVSARMVEASLVYGYQSVVTRALSRRDDIGSRGLQDDDDLGDRLAFEADYEEANLITWAPAFPVESTPQTWAYPKDYTYPDEGAQDRPRMEPLAQQRIFFDDAMDERMVLWTWASDTLLPAPNTDPGSLPYPGKAKELHHPSAAGDKLHEPLDGAYSAQDTNTPLQPRNPQRKFRTRVEPE